MTGWVAKATPAVAVADGWVAMTSLLAAAGLTATELEVAWARLPLVKLSVIVSALSSKRLLKVAMPCETVTWVVPSSGPEPLASATDTVVLLSPVSTLPYVSSS